MFAKKNTGLKQGQSHWLFHRRRPGVRARNPQVEKFFKSDVVEDKTNALIREGIQNSLDARQEQQYGEIPIRISIQFGQTMYSNTAEFFPGLFDHLQAASSKLGDIPQIDEPIKYLVFEDFNTSGLLGDPHEWDPENDGNAFFNFFRGEGVTEKAGNQRGRHGVGKMVFSLASRARSIIGVTQTTKSGPLLMGTSTLVLHKKEGVSYDPDGWYGDIHNIENEDLIIPVQDLDVVKRFKQAFKLERESETGLSIIVPWLDKSVTVNATLQSVLRGFFWPVMQGSLLVDIRNENGELMTVSSESIENLVENITTNPIDIGDQLRSSVSLSKWALSLPTDSIQIASAPPHGKAQKWSADLLSDKVKAILRSELTDGNPIALKLPMSIREKSQSAESSLPTEFNIYVTPDDTCSDSCIQFIREGLLISGVRSSRKPGYRALVIIDDGPLAKFLGDAENPSHTEWQKENVSAKYSFHDAALKYITHSVSNLIKTLHDDQKTADPTILLDLFSLPAEDSKTKSSQKKQTEKPGEITIPPDLEIKGTKPRRYHLQKRENGFVIRQGVPEAELPKTIDIEMAYKARRGNSIKKYGKSDFDIASKQFEVNLSGGRVLHCKDNHLKIAVQDSNFELEVTGFDINRDLVLDPKLDKNLEEFIDGEES